MSVQETPPRGWRALRAPRRFRCYALPEGFTPPAGARAAALARAAADALCVGPVTPVCREIGRHVWLCAFLHGADRRHWLATYEDGRPAGLDYVPRRAYLAILDWPHAYLYLAGPDDARAAALLQAFNGPLFPDRRPAEPFRPLRFDLAPLWLLPPEARRPADPAARWSELRLKGLAWREPGRGGALGQRQWPLDGFDELDGTGAPIPERLVSLAFALRPRAATHAYVAELYHDAPLLRATLTPTTLPALAALLSLTTTA